MSEFRSWLSFWASCLRWAFWRWERNRMLTFSLPTILSLFYWLSVLIGSYGIAQFVIKQELTWHVYGLLILIIAIFVAPYKLWKKQKERADKAENELKPCILAKPIVIDYGRLACIRVTNVGNEIIRNCVSYLQAVYWETNDKRLRQKKSIPSVCLQWSPRHGGEDKKKELTFTREADLNIVEFRSQGRAQLCVFNSNLHSVFNFNRPYSLELEKETLIFDIEISAENCAPLRRKYKLIYNPEGKLDFTIYEATNF